MSKIFTIRQGDYVSEPATIKVVFLSEPPPPVERSPATGGIAARA